jgi:hypothetical protein
MYVVDFWDRKGDVGSAKAQDRQKGGGHGDLNKTGTKKECCPIPGRSTAGPALKRGWVITPGRY